MNVNSNHSSEQLLSTKLELGKIQDAKPQPQIASSPAKMDSNKLGFSIGSTSCSKGFMQGALDNCLVANKSGPILPSLDQPDLAIPPIFKSQECGPRVDDGENLRLCKFGILGSKKKLAVVGNSHALQWVDALSDSNSNPGFEVTSFAGPILAIDPPSYYSITQADNIVKLSQQIVEMTKGNKYQIVFWTQWVSQVFIPAGKNLDWLKSQYQNIIMTYKNSGTPLVILRDNPNPQYTNTSVPDCLFNNPSNYLKCQGISYSWILEDPLADVAQSMDVPVISLNDLMCFDGNCPSVINGIRVYLDDNHLTSQWTQKVSPILWKRLVFLITK